MSKHATVPIGEYMIPLIGVPKDSTQEACSKCGKIVHLSTVVLDFRGKPVCQKCLEKKGKP